MQLKGRPVANAIRERILAGVEECRNAGAGVPCLAILRVGNRPDDVSYEKRVVKNCSRLGLDAQVSALPENADTDAVLEAMEALNTNDRVHGILVFRPLPEGVDEEAVRRRICPEKDIDCMSPRNLAGIFEGEPDALPPCTPEAVIAILKHYGYSLTGKNVVIVNRSMVLGKPLSMLFLAGNATVTVCHSRTRNLEEITGAADIVVTGVGRAGYFGRQYFSAHSVVVDVGINVDENGRLCGDVCFEEVKTAVAALTPVPGGVGTVTSMLLLEHVVRACRKRHENQGQGARERV